MAAGYLLAAFAVRVSAFVLCLGFFPRFFVPWAVKSALAAALIVFLAPSVLGSSGGLVSLDPAAADGLTLLFSPVTQLFAPSAGFYSAEVFSYTLILREFLIGFLLALAVSFGAYAVQLTGRWFTSLCLGPFGSKDGTDHPALTIRGLEMVYILLAAGIFFNSAIIAAVFDYFGRSLLIIPLAGQQGAAEMLSHEVLKSTAVSAGRMAISAAFILFIPVFLVSLCCDLAALPYKRFFPSAFDQSLVAAVKIPVLLLLLLLSLYPFRENLEILIGESLGSARTQAVIQGLTVEQSIN